MRHILCRNRTRAHRARARVRCTRQFLRLLAAAERGPGRAERGSPCRRSRSKTPTTLVVPAKAGTQRLGSSALDPRAPLSRGEGRTEKPRAPHAGRARDRAHSGYAPGMARNPNPAALREPLAQRGARLRGCVSLVTFFAQAKKVTRPPGWRTKPHMDVSRLSRSARNKSESKIKMDPGLRRDDGGMDPGLRREDGRMDDARMDYGVRRDDEGRDQNGFPGTTGLNARSASERKKTCELPTSAPAATRAPSANKPKAHRARYP